MATVSISNAKIEPSYQVKVKKLFKDVVIPELATDGSAGFDIRAYLYDEEIKDKVARVSLQPNQELKINTGLSFQLPAGTALLLLPRSSMGIKKNLILKNTVGLLDSDYRGECLIFVKNIGNEIVFIENGERLVQGLIVPYMRPNFIEVDKLDSTERGANGFGSSGRI